ncbi:MAG: DUF1638 domain-containing protein [Anaerolineales bacterium]|jgi:hypothetical protein
MKLKCIACEVLARPLYLCAARSPHIVDIELVKKGLHNQPVILRDRLQTAIDNTDEKDFDAILLAYGLCGQATAGLMAQRIPVVIPRAHDCITLFLGSRQKYQEQFEHEPGTFWYAQDYIERDDGSGAVLSMGSGTDTELEAVYNEYVQKYGKDNADYLMEVMGAWQAHYKRAVFIDLQVGNGASVETRARDEAARRGWSYERMNGDLILIRRLLQGDWENDFLVLPPGQKVIMAHDEQIIGCAIDD